jgi:Holliday junction resolvasome RuvABC DNA-binding subunit
VKAEAGSARADREAVGNAEPASFDREAGPEAAPPSAVIDVALRGLLSLGFARPDARRALDVVAQRRCSSAEAPPIQELLREAIASLT